MVDPLFETLNATQNYWKKHSRNKILVERIGIYIDFWPNIGCVYRCIHRVNMFHVLFSFSRLVGGKLPVRQLHGLAWSFTQGNSHGISWDELDTAFARGTQRDGGIFSKVDGPPNIQDPLETMVNGSIGDLLTHIFGPFRGCFLWGGCLPSFCPSWLVVSDTSPAWPWETTEGLPNQFWAYNCSSLVAKPWSTSFFCMKRREAVKPMQIPWVTCKRWRSPKRGSGATLIGGDPAVIQQCRGCFNQQHMGGPAAKNGHRTNQPWVI